MRKYALLLIIILTLTHTLFGQYFDYASLGYNTVTKIDTDGDITAWKEFFLNDKRFSKMQIDYNLGDIIFMEEKRVIKLNSGLYNCVVVYPFMNDSGFNYFEEEEGYEFVDHEIYRVTDGKLVYVEQGHYISEKIEYSDKGIKVTMKRKRGRSNDSYFLNFYNIPEEQIYDKFMRQLLSSMREKLLHLRMRELGEGYYEKLLKKITRTELELYKNFMLAKHQYKFQEPTWIDFIKEYSYYTNGSRSFFEAVGNFSFDERDLFKLIQRELADKYFVVGDYYKTKDYLRLRDKASLSGNTLTTISANDWVKILEEGKEDTIDDIKSVWVKVKLLNNKEGWCFGGYLGY